MASLVLVRKVYMPSRPFTVCVAPFVNSPYEVWNAPEA